MSQVRVAFLVSGGGTTMEAIMQAIADNSLPGVVPALVIASKPGIGALAKAEKYGLRKDQLLVMHPKDRGTPEKFGEALRDACHANGVNFVGQYGWMPKTPSVFIDAFLGRIVNQHPATLDPGHPHFGGRGMHGLAAVASVYRYAELNGWQDAFIEATTHHVVTALDEGPLIAVRRLDIRPGEGPKSLQDRLLPLEWELQIDVLRQLATTGTLPSFEREKRLITEKNLSLLVEAMAWGIAHAQAH